MSETKDNDNTNSGPPRRRPNDDNAEVSRKKPKLPKQVVDELLKEPGLAKVIETAAIASDPDTVKVYDNARRFEKKQDQWSCVEFYWDNPSSPPSILKKLSGTGRLTVPTIEEITRFDKHQDLMDSVDQQVKAFVKEGYTEMEHFVKLHKIHLPSFHWVFEDTESSDDKDEKVNPTDSFVRGRPALLKGEDWPFSDTVFLFQVNLAEVPLRMQQVVGKQGLLQVFWDKEEYSEGYARIISSTDFNKLELRLSEEQEEDGEQPHGIPLRPGRVTGWIERPDYPEDFNYSFAILTDDEEIPETTLLANQSSSLSSQGEHGVKFGGYPLYCQEEGPSLQERQPCNVCNKNHLFRTETINIYMEWGGTAQIMYCPETPDQIEIKASCT